MCRFGRALPHVHFGSPISSFLFRPIRHITRGRRCTQTVRVLLLSVRPSSDNAVGVLSFLPRMPQWVGKALHFLTDLLLCILNFPAYNNVSE